MQDTLRGLEHFAHIYSLCIQLHTIASYTCRERTVGTHHIKQVFISLENEVEIRKREFLQNKFQFVGHFINHEGIGPVPEKTQKISKLESPVTPCRNIK